jgi:hypothetical protein
MKGKCSICGGDIAGNYKFCPTCGREIQPDGYRVEIIELDIDPYNFWKVTTEGDCEGRSTKHLGTYEGFIDDIAFKLANQAYYGLRFDVAEPLNTAVEKDEATISLDISSGTWTLSPASRAATIQNWLKRRGRNVGVEESNYYACVKLTKQERV